MDRKVAILSLIALSCIGCYNSFDSLETDSYDSSAPEPNATIEHLHKAFDAGVRYIEEDIVMRGKVTANDEGGNFFMSFIIEDDGYAIEVLDGLYNSYVRHPIGADIILCAKGLAMDSYNGMLRLGLPGDIDSPYSVEHLESEAIVDKHIWIKAIGDKPLAQSIDLADVNARCNIGSLVRVDNLTFAGVEQSQWAGYTLFCTPARDSLWCYTSEYATFAREYIPYDRVSLTGIFKIGAVDTLPAQRIIQMRDAMDCIY